MKSFFAHHLPFPPQLQPKPKPSLRMQRAAAFSLTEVVIAMGVAALAFTSIIALFPLGLGMSKESYESTQAALLAQSILADLRDQGSSSSGKLIQKGGSNAMTSTNYDTIPLSASTASGDRYIYLAYDQKVRTDSSNSPVMLRPMTSSVSVTGPAEPNWFKTNPPAGALLLAKVSLKQTFKFVSPSSRSGGYLQRVDVTIESPATASPSNRVQYTFSGVIPYQ